MRASDGQDGVRYRAHVIFNNVVLGLWYLASALVYGEISPS